MKLRHTIPATLIALAALAGLAAPASATSLAGTLSGDATLTPTGMPGVYVSNFSGEADDVTFGAFTLSGQSTVDFSHAPSVTIESGMFSETFSNGTVFGTDSGDGTASGKGTATVTIDLLVTGGTGAFAGVKGEITATEMITMTGKTTEFDHRKLYRLGECGAPARRTAAVRRRRDRLGGVGTPGGKETLRLRPREADRVAARRRRMVPDSENATGLFDQPFALV